VRIVQPALALGAFVSGTLVALVTELTHTNAHDRHWAHVTIAADGCDRAGRWLSYRAQAHPHTVSEQRIVSCFLSIVTAGVITHALYLYYTSHRKWRYRTYVGAMRSSLRSCTLERDLASLPTALRPRVWLRLGEYSRVLVLGSETYENLVSTMADTRTHSLHPTLALG
jgi:hypothetical protein